MKKIVKQSEPRSLREHRSKTHVFANYENYPKDDLRKSLLEEQGYLCCYCMSRITSERMKIEHWKPFTKYVSLRLDYHNLLGACMGNKGARTKREHCDTKKDDDEIRINPVDRYRNCEDIVSYLPDGTIYSTDVSINHDLDKTLNLNLDFLKKNRKVALENVISQLNKKFPNKTWNKITLQNVISELNTKDENGYYSEYCQIAISYLKSKL